MYLILLFILETNAFILQNRTKFKINDIPISGSIDVAISTQTENFNFWPKIFTIMQASNKVKIVITSKKPIEVTLYTTIGIPLHFKGLKISYTGNPTYYQINNIDDNTNKISLEIYQMETDWFKLFSTIMAIFTFFVLTLHKRDHRISQVFLFILLTIEILKSSDYDKTAEKIVHKILF